MGYIFLDESGDLGFSKNSSKWFLFTLALVSSPRSLEHITKKVWRTLRKKHQSLSELHAYHSDHATRRRMFTALSELEDLAIMCIVLNKQKVYIDLQNQKNYLYNYTANILLDRLCRNTHSAPDNKINLFVDRRDTKKKLRENFTKYLTDSMLSRGRGGFKVTLHSSIDNKSIQAVDFISWAIFRKYERGDYEFYEIIKSKIVEEKLLFT